jgi:nitrite reductase/ring-hydroxylating ferredoxin subunit
MQMVGQPGGRWWTVALSESVPSMQPLGVRCDGKEYVLFRGAAGAVCALADQCAHRRAPLSMGCVTAEGLVQCPYHGWRYNGKTGACEDIPNLADNERVPRTYRVAAFPVVEEAGWIHLWSGAGEPTSVPPQLLLAAGPEQWHGETLIAYPHDALVDLLLDAPAIVLDTARLTVFDLHRFGDPIAQTDHVFVKYAAAPKTRRSGKKIIADFPAALSLRVSHAGNLAHVDVHTQAGERVSSLILAFSPSGRALTSVRWRGAGLTDESGGTRIEVRRTIDPWAASRATEYCSRLRNPTDSTAITAEGTLHERSHA